MVGRICRREVHVAQPEERVRDVARRMAERRVGSVVVTRDGKPIGVLTDRDVVERVVAAGLDPDRVTVGSAMTSPPVTAPEDVPIEDVLRLMVAGAQRRVVVVDRADHLVGIVALDDVLELLSEELGAIGRLVARQQPVG
jgi:CBS domain-containing protein